MDDYLAGLLVKCTLGILSRTARVNTVGRGDFGKIFTTSPPGSVGPGIKTK
jgi:hypothetical protein